MVENKFFWIGGDLWLDWVNTQAVSGGEIVELVGDFADLMSWLRLAQVISPAEQHAMENWSTKKREAVLEEVRKLRANLRQLCEAIGEKAEVPNELLKVLNVHLAQRASTLQLRHEENHLKLVESLDMGDELGVLFPIASSAANWLVSAEWKLLKKCANPNCILWFYDTSKSHSRRWCSMEGCGNRHKVASHYQKKSAGVA